MSSALGSAIARYDELSQCRGRFDRFAAGRSGEWCELPHDIFGDQAQAEDGAAHGAAEAPDVHDVDKDQICPARQVFSREAIEPVRVPRGGGSFEIAHLADNMGIEVGDIGVVDHAEIEHEVTAAQEFRHFEDMRVASVDGATGVQPVEIRARKARLVPQGRVRGRGALDRSDKAIRQRVTRRDVSGAKAYRQIERTLPGEREEEPAGRDFTGLGCVGDYCVVRIRSEAVGGG